MSEARFTAEETEGFEWNRAQWDERVEAHWASAMYRAHAEAFIKATRRPA